ncbi:MAG: CAP domain-containing protein [Acidobacteriota bacterium]
MRIKFSSFPRQFFSFSIFPVFLLAIFFSNSFAQNETKAKKVSYETIASANEKTDPARPRLAEDSKNKEEKPKTEEKTAETPPAIVLVTSASVISQIERKAFDILNEKRKENGLAPIIWSEDMAKVARIHSENMAKYKFFSHQGLDGTMVNDRADALGISKWKAIGENIAFNHGYDNPVEFACQRWMQSQSHRENILNPRWKEAGVGVAITAEGTYYFTQVFVLR